MLLRKCNVCHLRSSDLNLFVKNKSHLGGRKNLCKPCAQNRQRTSARKYRLWVRELLMTLKNNPCIDCGCIYPSYVMQFDHIRGTKKFSIANLIGHFKRKDEIFQELAKCELVCANCHMLRTYSKERLMKADAIVYSYSGWSAGLIL